MFNIVLALAQYTNTTKPSERRRFRNQLKILLQGGFFWSDFLHFVYASNLFRKLKFNFYPLAIQLGDKKMLGALWSAGFGFSHGQFLQQDLQAWNELLINPNNSLTQWRKRFLQVKQKWIKVVLDQDLIGLISFLSSPESVLLDYEAFCSWFSAQDIAWLFNDSVISYVVLQDNPNALEGCPHCSVNIAACDGLLLLAAYYGCSHVLQKLRRLASTFGRDRAAIVLINRLIELEYSHSSTVLACQELFKLYEECLEVLLLTDSAISANAIEQSLRKLFTHDNHLYSHLRVTLATKILQPALQYHPELDLKRKIFIDEAIIGELLRRQCYLSYPTDFFKVLLRTRRYPAEDGDWCIEFLLRHGDYKEALGILRNGAFTERGLYWAFMNACRANDIEFIRELIVAANVDKETLAAWTKGLERSVCKKRLRKELEKQFKKVTLQEQGEAFPNERNLNSSTICWKCG